MTYTVWGRENCPWCDAAKQLLERYHIEYDYVPLTADNLPTFSQITGGSKTVPQIFDDINNHIGGYEDLRDLLE